MTVHAPPATRYAETRRECARWFGVSAQCLDNWVGKGCPTEPGNGPGTRFDLLAVARWRYGTPAAEPATGPTLDPRAESAALSRARRSEIELRIAERARQLIPAREFERALAEPLKHAACILEDLPDRLERRVGLPAQYIDEVIAVCDQLREDIYQAIIAGATRD